MGLSVWFSYFLPTRGRGGEGGACRGRLHRPASPAALHFTVKSGTLHGTERDTHSTGGPCGKEQERYREPRVVPVPLAQHLVLSDPTSR